MADKSDKTVKGGENESQDLQILEIEYEKAKERLNQQQETLKEFSHEGMQMFRILLLFVGVPIAVLGALEPNTLFQINDLISSKNCAVSGLNTCFLSIGSVSAITGVCLVLSAGMNILAAGYEARGVHNASNPEDIHQAILDDHSLGDYFQARLKEYRDRIHHNDRVISVEESLLMTGKITLMMSTFGITTIVVVLLKDSPLGVAWWVAVLVLFFFSTTFPFIHVPKDYRQADRYFQYNPLYETDYEAKSDSKNGSISGSECSEKKESDKPEPNR